MIIAEVLDVHTYPSTVDSKLKTMDDSESKLSFVRIGFGAIYLNVQDYRDALQRFGNKTVTVF
jgi:hypothetical protein